MNILGIESSCDETAAAIVENGTNVLSSVITSTKDIFSNSGGVVPEDAARRQVESILPVIHTALRDSGLSVDALDAIAVTKGPGLLGSLLVGTVTARTLSGLWKKPLIGVHHTFGHLSSVWVSQTETDFHFPSLTLSASGGHTDLWLRTAHTKGKLLGRTRDDAAGEAFDKGASMLGLPYPGGPSIARAASSGNELAYTLPIALQKEDTFDFSFSGVKTALKNLIHDTPEVEDLAASYQFAICAQLVDRIKMALQRYPEIQEIHLVGGVSANSRLRDLIQTSLPNVPLRTPANIQYCTDNAAMIAAGAYFMVQEQPHVLHEEFITAATLPLDKCITLECS